MSINVFFSSSLIGSISASVVAKRLHAADANVLCVERAKCGLDDSYYDLNVIIERYFPWNRVLHVDRDEMAWPSKDNVIKFYATVWKICRYYKSFGVHINEQIKDLGKIDNIYASMPVKFWSLVGNKDAKLNVIEHSIQEYNLLCSMCDQSYPRNRVKALLDELIGYRQLIRCVPSRFVLLDGGRSMLLKNIRSDKIPHLSIDAKEDIAELSRFFRGEFKKEFPDAYEELEDIRRQMERFRNRYIYLPTGEVSGADYFRYIEEQSKYVSLSDACVLIKNHPFDVNTYSEYFTGRCKAFEFKVRTNRMLPAELLMGMLDMPTLWGSYSSALIYSYWWYGTIPLLSVVESHPIDELMRKEYKNFVPYEFSQFSPAKRGEL